MIVRTKANDILNSLVKSGSSYYYIGLSTTTPDANGGNFTEPQSPTEYKRVSLDNKMGTASNAIIKNTDIIFFPEAENSGWGTITHFGIFTAKTGGGTPIFWGELSSPVQIPQNYIPIFRAGKLQIGLDQDPADPE